MLLRKHKDQSVDPWSHVKLGTVLCDVNPSIPTARQEAEIGKLPESEEPSNLEISDDETQTR